MIENGWKKLRRPWVLILTLILSGKFQKKKIFFLVIQPFCIFIFISDSDDEGKISNQKRRAKNNAMASMKAELKHLLSQPLIAQGISTRYITSGSRLIVDDLLAGNREFIYILLGLNFDWLKNNKKVNEAMLGLKKAEAGSDMIVAKEKKRKKQLEGSKEDVEEEWGGITADM